MPCRLSCSKLAHTAFGTDNRGTVRISPSVFTKYSECEKFINILKNFEKLKKTKIITLFIKLRVIKYK